VDRQDKARADVGEMDPDALIGTVDMSDIDYVRVVFNSKGIVIDVLWPKTPFIEGPHNDPITRVPAHGGKHARFSDDLPQPPPLPPSLTFPRLPSGIQTSPIVAPHEAGAGVALANTEVNLGGLRGRESGNGTDFGSTPDSTLILRRMEELVDQVQSQKRALEQMYDQKNGPKKKHNTVFLKDSIATILALSGQDEEPHGSSVIYQQTLAPMEKWTGKETDKIKDGAKWIRQALRQARRTRIHFIEFLDNSVEGPGQAWAEGLSREHSRYTLQQAQINSGDIIVMNYQATSQGKPVTLASQVTEEFVLESFHQSFLHNKVNQVEAAQVSLFGGALSQAPKEPLSDYLLRFKAKVWEASLILEETPLQMISLLYKGLLPHLKQHGFNDKKHNKLFVTFAAYEEFLTEKESTFIRMRGFAHFQVSTPAPGTPLRIAPVRASEPVYNLVDDSYFDEYFDQEEEEYYSGMLNALGPRRSAQQKPKPSASQVVSIPGPTVGSQPIEVRKRDIAFFLKFADDSADWPLNGTPFSGPLKDNTVPGSRPSHRDQVTQLMKFLRPSIQDATCTAVFDTAKAHNRAWVWCILHGSTAHHTHLCPCLLKAFPARTKAYNRDKTEYKQHVNLMRRQEGAYSGEEEQD
jgi:hypothetical protein